MRIWEYGFSWISGTRLDIFKLGSEVEAGDLKVQGRRLANCGSHSGAM